MKKRFNSKTKKNYKVIIYLIMIFISFNATLSLLLNKDITASEFLLNILLNETTNKDNLILKRINASIASPKEIMYKSLNKIIQKDNLSVFSNVENDNFSYEDSNSTYVEDPNPSVVDKPIVYIYNTHQLEEYEQTVSHTYSVKPNVMIASYILKEKLNESDIPSIVETANIKEYLNNNSLRYSYSYVASKYFMESALKENPSLVYLIDIHRDSARYDKTLLDLNGKKYARVLFVVGMEHEKHQLNLSFAEQLNNAIETKYPGISRGISKKSGENVNGVYNQNMSEHAILIEVGGVDNTMEEVYNTCIAISEILSEYIKVQNGN